MMLGIAASRSTRSPRVRAIRGGAMWVMKRATSTASGTRPWAAQRPGTGAGHPGRLGPDHAQIAAELRISVRAVGSHLARIRDKTGCRRRVDLTRLALAAGLD